MTVLAFIGACIGGACIGAVVGFVVVVGSIERAPE